MVTEKFLTIPQILNLILISSDSLTQLICIKNLNINILIYLNVGKIKVKLEQTKIMPLKYTPKL